MKKKRVVELGLAVTMMASLVSGCSSNKKDDKTVSNAKAVEATVTEIDFWYSGGKTAVGVFGDIVEDFNASQSRYHINAVTQADYTETYEKLQAGIAGKNAPDMALLDVDKARNLSNKNLVADLRTFIESDSEYKAEDYLEVFFNQGYDKDGKLFAFPAYGTTQVMYYNIAAFAEAGINAEDIKTWQDLEAAAAKMARADGSFYGWEPMWGSGNMVDAALSNGASLFSEDGKTVTINSTEWVEVFECFRRWIHEDKTMKINYGGQGWEYWYKTIDDVLQNKAGGYTGSSGDQADLDFSIVAAMEQPGFGSNPSAPAASALQLVMLDSSSDAEKQGVYEFMKFFTNAKNQAKWSMATGYVAVNSNTSEDADFKKYVEENPQALVPLQQASHGSIIPEDPTGGKILDALTIAADKVEIEGISAQEALDEAQETAQAALDNVK
ncbi:extracellular solute-binding protein [Anaerosporobacter sp.]|uniref:extracellular solute-binding protein n=1 Tax=Anaerosporobacter sp. TaxID=1872529 RepID=UPI00286FA51A|nr:extracellular solute-binding protein [Anaerosporobacter sp.]